MRTLFTGDDLIWSENDKGVQEQPDVLKENIEKWGVKISVEKNEAMEMTRQKEEGRGLLKLEV